MIGTPEHGRRLSLAAGIGLEKCGHCDRLCPFCPRLIAAIPGLAPPPVEAPHNAPSVAESLARLAAMKACPHWIRSSSCGCGNNRCALGKGAAGVVSHRDCSECLDAGRIRPAG